MDYEQLQRLHALKTAAHLSEQEYQAEKQKLLHNEDTRTSDRKSNRQRSNISRAILIILTIYFALNIKTVILAITFYDFEISIPIWVKILAYTGSTSLSSLFLGIYYGQILGTVNAGIWNYLSNLILVVFEVAALSSLALARVRAFSNILQATVISSITIFGVLIAGSIVHWTLPSLAILIAATHTAIFYTLVIWFVLRIVHRNNGDL